MENKLYAQVVGSIMYVMLCTKPNFSFTISLINRFQSNLVKPVGQLLKEV